MEAVGGCRTISCPLARTGGPSVRSAMKHPKGVVECGGLLERISFWTTNCARRCPPDSHPISGDSRRGAMVHPVQIVTNYEGSGLVRLLP